MTRPTAVILATVFAWGCDSSPETADAAESVSRPLRTSAVSATAQTGKSL